MEMPQFDREIKKDKCYLLVWRTTQSVYFSFLFSDQHCYIAYGSIYTIQLKTCYRTS